MGVKWEGRLIVVKCFEGFELFFFVGYVVFG